jgi:hypothetical protein
MAETINAPATGPWLVLLALCLLSVGLMLGWRTRRFLAAARCALAHRHGDLLPTAPDLDSIAVHLPQIRFLTEDRRTVMFGGRVGWRMPGPDQPVRVRFDPARPELAAVDDPLALHGAWAIFVLAGVLLLAIAAARAWLG